MALSKEANALIMTLFYNLVGLMGKKKIRFYLES